MIVRISNGSVVNELDCMYACMGMGDSNCVAFNFLKGTFHENIDCMSCLPLVTNADVAEGLSNIITLYDASELCFCS